MSAVLRLVVQDGTARAELVRGAAVIWAAEASFTTPADLEHIVRQLAARDTMPSRPGALNVELGGPLAQVRTLAGLPPVRPAQLRALVSTQASRFFRRNGTPLVTDACWATKEARRRGTAVAAAAEESWVEAVLRGAGVAGFTVESLQPSGAPDGARLELLPPDERHRRRARAMLSVRRLAAVAGLAWASAGMTYLVRLDRERDRVARDIAELERPAQAVRAARRVLEEAAGMVETLEQASRERSAVIGRMAAIGAALPDSAYLTALAIDTAGGGEMGVVARRSAEILAALDGSGAVVAPRLGGSVIREAAGGRDWDQFSVAFGAGGTR